MKFLLEINECLNYYSNIDFSCSPHFERDCIENEFLNLFLGFELSSSS